MATRYLALTTTTSSTPYWTMVKIKDGVPSVVANLPAAGSGLRACEWSPNGKVLLMARNTATSTTSVWFTVVENKGDDVFEFWDQENSTFDQTTSRNFVEVVWLSDTIVIALSSQGMMQGIVNYDTKSIQWTTINTYVGFGFSSIRPTTRGYLVHLPAAPWMVYVTLVDGAVSVTPVVGAPTYQVGASTFTSDEKTLYWITLQTKDLYYATITISGTTVTIGAPTTWTMRDTTSGGRNQLIILPGDDRIFAPLNGAPRFFCVAKYPTGLVNTQIASGFSGAITRWIRNPDDGKIIVVLSANTLRLRAMVVSDDRTLLTGDGVMEALPEISSSWFYTDASLSRSFSDPVAVPSQYNAALAHIADPTFNPANLKLALISQPGYFNAADESLGSVLASSGEVFGGNWPQGGTPVATSAISRVGTGPDHALDLTFTPIDYTDSSSLTFRGIVVYDDSHPAKLPLIYAEYPEARQINTLDRVEFAFSDGHSIVFSEAVG